VVSLNVYNLMADELQRYTLPDSGKDEEGGRVYTDNSELYLPSVSTVLDEMPEPDGIKYWKQNNSGTPSTEYKNQHCWSCGFDTEQKYLTASQATDRQSYGGVWQCTDCGSIDYFHWRDILQYKGNRGTLIHYNLLNEFEEDDMYSVDEENSTEELKLEGDWSRYREDLTYAEEAWEQIKRVRGISEENVLNVECFVTNTGVGYAGQFDLLYVDEDSNVVLSDIKTSNAEYAPYDKHKLQLTAYAHALELDVDILEVLIIHPDSQTWKISHDSDWSEDVDDLWAEFRELREGMGDVEDRMKQIAQDGVDDAESA